MMTPLVSIVSFAAAVAVYAAAIAAIARASLRHRGH